MQTNNLLDFKNAQGATRKIADITQQSGVLMAVTINGKTEIKKVIAEDGQVVRGDGGGVTLPTRLPNPNKLELRLGIGGSSGVYEYDGIESKSITISPGALGAASNGFVMLDPVWTGSVSGNVTGSTVSVQICSVSGNMYKAYLIEGGVGFGGHVEGGYFSCIARHGRGTTNFAFSAQGILVNIGFSVSSSAIYLNNLTTFSTASTPYYQIMAVYGLR